MPLGKRRILSRAITVEAVGGQHYKRSGNYACQRITDGEDDFLDTVSDAFEQLKRLPTGRQLIKEIDESGKTCVVFCGSTNRSSVHAGAAILQDIDDKRGTLDRYALPLSDYATMCISDNLSVGSDLNQQQLDAAIALRKQKVAAFNDPIMTDMEKGFRNNNSVFQVFFNRIARTHGLNTENYIAQRSGVPASRIDEYLHGEKRVNTSDNFKILFGLYDWVIRGAGTNTAVRLVPEVAITSPANAPTWFQKKRGINRFDKSADEVRADIMLGHELIHAWRMMTGRRLVSSGWEEEMMTVGLGAGANLAFTENKLRVEAGHPTRTSYPGLPAATIAGNTMLSV